jgi:hypothetical protein
MTLVHFVYLLQALNVVDVTLVIIYSLLRFVHRAMKVVLFVQVAHSMYALAALQDIT